MKRPSASNAEAFVRCTASHVLPQHESYQEYTEAGTEGHALLGAVINLVPGAAGRLESAMPGVMTKLSEAMNGVENARAEEAYVVDVEKRTSRLLGVNIDRKYEQALGRKLTKYEICCSLDVHARKDGVRWVRDFKFGITSSWWQIYVQCMAVLWMTGVKDSEVDAGFLFVDVQDEAAPEIREDAVTVYLMDLDERADELMTAFGYADELEGMLAKGIHYSDLKVVEGKWCTYCGAFPNCGAKWKLAKSMLSLDVVGHVGALTPEQCGDAWQKLAEIKKNIIKKTEAALKQRMLVEGGFPTADGKRLKMLPMPGRASLDKEGAIALLRVLGATEEEILGLVRQGEGYDQVRKVNS